MTFGLTPKGFYRKRLPDLKAENENALIAEFGEINLQPQSVFGQLVGVFAKTLADIWENMEDVYYSQYPNTAEGVPLDFLVALNGISRLQKARTIAVCALEGNESTLVPKGSLIRQPETNEVFFNEEDILISKNRTYSATVSLTGLNDLPYNLTINKNPYVYSLNKIDFDSLFVASNSIVISVNGTSMQPISFNTDSQTTIDSVATALQNLNEIDTATTKLGLVIQFTSDFETGNVTVTKINGNVLDVVPFDTSHTVTLANLAQKIREEASVNNCTVTGSREITIDPVDSGAFEVESISTTGGTTQPTTIDQRIDIIPTAGSVVAIDSVLVTGGSSQPNHTVSALTPANEKSVISGLIALVNNGLDRVTAQNVNDTTLKIESNDLESFFDLEANSNINIEKYASPGKFVSQNFGPLPAPANSVNEIITPISGWDAVKNPEDGIMGRNIETDAELRLRRENSLSVVGSSTVNAIKSKILQEVNGVSKVLVFENETMTQQDILVVFSADFVQGNQINFIINGAPLPAITYATNHLNTMQLIEDQLKNVNGIKNVTVGGIGNRTLTIGFVEGTDFKIDNSGITGGASQGTVNTSGGRAPKSFEVVAQGGDSLEIANKIWETKPAGIKTFGNTNFTVYDLSDLPHVVSFSRAEPVYIWISLDLHKYNEETFPNNGTELVKEVIEEYGNSLSISEDVLLQRVLCQIFKVNGISSGDLQIAFTVNENGTPVFGTSDIPINGSQIADFDRSRMIVGVV